MKKAPADFRGAVVRLVYMPGINPGSALCRTPAPSTIVSVLSSLHFHNYIYCMCKADKYEWDETKTGLIMPSDEEDAAINSGIASAPDTFELDERFFKQAKRGRPSLPPEKRKQQVTMLLDPDVIAHFKKDGRGWQTRLNAKLREALGL
jgi:uncharacterized protein (DUF4415 family)